MPANDLPFRVLRLFAAALVLLGLCSGPGCKDRPADSTGPAKQEGGRRMPK